MTGTYTDSGCGGRSPLYTRFDAMYDSLRTWQRLVLWLVTGLLALRVPPLLSSTPAEKTALILFVAMGSFVALAALFSWLDRR